MFKDLAGNPVEVHTLVRLAAPITSASIIQAPFNPETDRTYVSEGVSGTIVAELGEHEAIFRPATTNQNYIVFSHQITRLGAPVGSDGWGSMDEASIENGIRVRFGQKYSVSLFEQEIDVPAGSLGLIISPPNNIGYALVRIIDDEAGYRDMGSDWYSMAIVVPIRILYWADEV